MAQRLRLSGSPLEMLGKQLASLVQKTSPFVAVPKAGMSGSIWVKPKLVAQIKYNEMTGSGVLRQPSYLGLRDDKKARDVRLEADTSATAVLDALNCGA
jgi:bifunctional non-homologous end joining protein LigD